MKRPDIDRVLDEAFRAVVGSPCRPVPALNPLEVSAERRAEIGRLRKAGWKTEAIATEVGVSTRAVTYHLRRLGMT